MQHTKNSNALLIAFGSIIFCLATATSTLVDRLRCYLVVVELLSVLPDAHGMGVHGRPALALLQCTWLRPFAGTSHRNYLVCYPLSSP